MGSVFEILPLPARIVPASPLSDEEFIAFARAHEPYRFERNDEGEIIVMTPVARRAGRREFTLAFELEIWAKSDGRGEVDSANTGWNLPDGWTLSPDASWISKERLQVFSAEEQEKFLPICPEFIAEVRSRSDSLPTVMEKMERWMRNGAKLGWLIDPYPATVFVYRPDQQPETLQRPPVLEGEGPIAGFRLGMERFWA